MDEARSESHLTSAEAFVEGGIQEACDDTCSICLEAFCESDPSTVTSCKHEFHLQCILEWCQRSSNCPMCWQPIGLKDPASQELLEGVERERSIRLNPARNSTIFHHPTLGDFELQHLPVGVNDADLEDRIIQHLAAAAAMGRARHVSRREGSRGRLSAHNRPQFLVFSTHPNSGEPEPPAVAVASPSIPLTGGGSELPHDIPHFPSGQTGQISGSTSSGDTVIPTNHTAYNSSASQSSTQNEDRAGPSDFQSISESWKSRLNAVSMRYKESISKSTRGWKERLFSRNTSVVDIGSEVRREVSAGIATVTRMIDRLETRENRGTGHVPASNNLGDSSATEQSNNINAETHHETLPNDNNSAALAGSSVST